MIAVLCASKHLSEKLCTLMNVGSESILIIPPNVQGETALSQYLLHNHVAVLIYEPSFLPDPTLCRSASPQTRFVIMVAPGEEGSVRQALRRGVCAVLDKPVRAEDLHGVYRLVCT